MNPDEMAPVEARFTGATICMEKARLAVPNFGIAPLGVGLAQSIPKDFRGASHFGRRGL